MPRRVSPGSRKKVAILDPPEIETVAELIKNGKANRILVMAGAGISTAAGIPDFRTPGTGLYDNLQAYNLPYPEAIFNIEYFKSRPEPFFTLARELYPGKYLPTWTHYFITLLHQKNLLLRCFTQNIDTLERLAGLPEDKIVEAHGSFAKSKCIGCRQPADPDDVRKAILDGDIPKCKFCGHGTVKPCITFFGEQLPDKFFKHLGDFNQCDLLIVIGTSLQVQPFASLIDRVGAATPRVLINREVVGVYKMANFGFDFDGKFKYLRDAFIQGSCDDGVRRLAQLCGWEDDLENLHAAGHEALRKQYDIKGPPKSVAQAAEDAIEALAGSFKEKAVINSEDERTEDAPNELGTPGVDNSAQPQQQQQQQHETSSSISSVSSSSYWSEQETSSSSSLSSSSLSQPLPSNLESRPKRELLEERSQPAEASQVRRTAVAVVVAEEPGASSKSVTAVQKVTVDAQDDLKGSADASLDGSNAMEKPKDKSGAVTKASL